MADVTIPQLPALLTPSQSPTDVYEMSDANSLNPSAKESRQQMVDYIQNNIAQQSISVHVNSDIGVDTVGNGTVLLPYATISFALSQIADASSSKVYLINAVGNFSDSDWAINPFINYDFNVGVYSVANQVTVDASWSTGGTCIIQNISGLDLQLGASFDLNVISATSSIIIFKNVKVSSSPVMQFIGNPAASNLLLLDAFSSSGSGIADVDVTNGSLQIINSCALNSLDYIVNDNAANTFLFIQDSLIQNISTLENATVNDHGFDFKASSFGDVSFIASSSGAFDVYSAGSLWTGAVTIDGVNATLHTDVINQTVNYLNGAAPNPNLEIIARYSVSAGTGIAYDPLTGVIDATGDINVEYQEVYDNTVATSLDANTDMSNGFPYTLSSTTEVARPFPDMTIAQSNALVSPINGGQLWNADSNRIRSNRGSDVTPIWGDGAYLSDIPVIVNDGSYGEMNFQGNATETVIATQGVPVKIAGTYVAGPLADFTHSNGVLTYTGAATKTFKVAFAISTSANLIAIDATATIALNGTHIINSEQTEFLGSTSPAWHTIPIQKIITLSTNDELSAFIQNDTNNDNITVYNLNFSPVSIGGTSNVTGDEVVISWNGLTTPTNVTATGLMDITGGVVSTTAEVNVVSLWDGSTTPVPITATGLMDITGGVVSTIAEENIVSLWDGSSTPVSVTAGTGIDITGGVITNVGVGGSGVSGNFVLASCTEAQTSYAFNVWSSMIVSLDGASQVDPGSLLVGESVSLNMTVNFDPSLIGGQPSLAGQFRLTFGPLSWEVPNVIFTNSSSRTGYLNFTVQRINTTEITIDITGWYITTSPVGMQQLIANPSLLVSNTYTYDENDPYPYDIEWKPSVGTITEYVTAEAINLKIIQYTSRLGGGAGSSTLQDAYDNGDGSITQVGGKRTTVQSDSNAAITISALVDGTISNPGELLFQASNSATTLIDSVRFRSYLLDDTPGSESSFYQVAVYSDAFGGSVEPMMVFNGQQANDFFGISTANNIPVRITGPAIIKNIVGIIPIDPSSTFTVESGITTQGSSPYPRLTSAQFAGIANPLKSLGVYDSDKDRISINRGTPGAPDIQDVAYISEVSQVLGTTILPETAYPQGAWTSVTGTLSGTNVVAANTFEIGQTVEIDITGTYITVVNGAPCQLRLAFGPAVLATSSVLSVTGVTGQKQWDLKFKITMVSATEFIASASGKYINSSDQVSNIDLVVAPFAQVFNPTVDNAIDVQFISNGVGTSTEFAASNLNIIKYK